MSAQETNVWPEVLSVGTLGMLEAKTETDFAFVVDSQEVRPMAKDLGVEDEQFNAFFALVGDGDFTVVYGMFGDTPYTDKMLYRVYPKES